MVDGGGAIEDASEDLRFASGVTVFGMLLGESEHAGSAKLELARELAASGVGRDELGYRRDFLALVDRARDGAALAD